ncbi:unnamed protein product [Caretta caretta]
MSSHQRRWLLKLNRIQVAPETQKDGKVQQRCVHVLIDITAVNQNPAFPTSFVPKHKSLPVEAGEALENSDILELPSGSVNFCSRPAEVIFRNLVTDQHILEWRGLVDYRGGPNKYALSCNVINFLEFLVHEKFAFIIRFSSVKICGQINRMQIYHEDAVQSPHKYPESMYSLNKLPAIGTPNTACQPPSVVIWTHIF